MATFNTIYGDLLTAKETAEATGFTMNQLRNWRIPARQQLAPFGFVSIGSSPHYRKVVVEAWIERNGGSNVKYVSAGLDAEFPITATTQLSVDRNNVVSILTKFTTENAYWQIETWIAKQGQGFLSRVWQPTWARVNEVLDEPVPYVTFNARWEDFTWFTQAVHVIRTYVAESQGLDISIAEIVKLPVGAVPPTKEKNY
jgi:hypothetical protein